MKAEIIMCITQSWCHEISERIALADVVRSLDGALSSISDAGVGCTCISDAHARVCACIFPFAFASIARLPKLLSNSVADIV